MVQNIIGKSGDREDCDRPSWLVWIARIRKRRPEIRVSVRREISPVRIAIMSHQEGGNYIRINIEILWVFIWQWHFGCVEGVFQKIPAVIFKPMTSAL